MGPRETNTNSDGGGVSVKDEREPEVVSVPFCYTVFAPLSESFIYLFLSLCSEFRNALSGAVVFA